MTHNIKCTTLNQFRESNFLKGLHKNMSFQFSINFFCDRMRPYEINVKLDQTQILLKLGIRLVDIKRRTLKGNSYPENNFSSVSKNLFIGRNFENLIGLQNNSKHVFMTSYGSRPVWLERNSAGISKKFIYDPPFYQ